MPRYAFEVQYLGKEYAGSQIQFKEDGFQIEKPTIQGEVEKALCTLTGYGNDFVITAQNRPIKTVFAGRTDAGVNAIAQVVHFDYDKALVASEFVDSMNNILPDDIAIMNMDEVTEEFHAQKSAKSRFYRYSFFNRRTKSAFDGVVPRFTFDCDVERIQEALECLLGEHDFTSFKASGTNNPNTICDIQAVNCTRNNDIIMIDIIANRFIYNMVRIIVGTILAIEKNKLDPKVMQKILGAKDRTKAGKTISPYGLTLVKVEY